MESKLKQLKVADLKDLLNRAQVTIPARANKPDLIATIIDSPVALNVYDELYGGGSVRPSGANTPRPPVAEEPEAKIQPAPAAPPEEQDILAPPEPFDWNAGVDASTESNGKNATEPTKATAAKPPSRKVAIPAAAAAQSTPSVTQKSPEAKTSASVADEDEEAKKRRTRAERFGLPVVTAPSQKQNNKTTKPVKKDAPAPTAAKKNESSSGANAKATKIGPISVEEDPEKLKARAMRFGLVEKTKHVKPSPEAAAAVTGKREVAPAPATGQKRASPATESTDTEEAERRRKRAERFGLPVKT